MLVMLKGRTCMLAWEAETLHTPPLVLQVLQVLLVLLVLLVPTLKKVSSLVHTARALNKAVKRIKAQV